MERELFLYLYDLAIALDKPLACRAPFTAAVIVAVAVWACVHERSIAWACDPAHWWGLEFGRLPSQSTMSRRLRSARVLALLQAMEDQLKTRQPAGCCQIVDAKPLAVGGCTKDPDACRGRAARDMAKGYKLFVIWGDGALPLAWHVGPMNCSEQRMCEQLLPEIRGGGYLLADKVYDANRLFRLAVEHGYQLVTPRKYPHQRISPNARHPARLHSIELTSRRFGEALLRYRDRIEQRFAQLTNFPGGLAPLPNHVRRQARVARWVRLKLLLYAAYLLHPPSLTPTPAVA